MSTYEPRNKQCVERVKEFLDQLVLSRTKQHEWSSYDAAKLCRWIRDGMKASAYHPEFSSYQTLPALFILRVRGNKVIAEPRLKGVQLLDSTTPNTIEAIKLYDGISTLQNVMSLFLTDKPKNARFPHFIPSPSELEHLYNYLTQRSYFIINHDDLGITLTTIDPGDDIRWMPHTN